MHERYGCALNQTGAATVLAGIRAGGTTLIAFPELAENQLAPSGLDENGVCQVLHRTRPLTVAGAAQGRLAPTYLTGFSPCFPLNFGM